MRRQSLRVVLLALALAPHAGRAQTTQLPVIVTYELHQARLAERDAARDPRGFWQRQIVTRIAEAAGRRPPVGAGAVVLLRFGIDRTGRLLAPAVAKTSGVPAADAAALASLEAAQPFPPMPAAVGVDRLDFTLPVRFR